MSRPVPKLTANLTPGNDESLVAGIFDVLTGKVIGSRPEGFTAPVRTLATADPSSWPGYQPSTTPATFEIHGMTTAPPELRTTIVCGFAPATAEISSLASPGRSKVGLSTPSESKFPTKTIATLALRAACTALLM